MIIKYVIILVSAYLLGSIPFGLLICKLKEGVDIRKQGSGKTGATNAARVAGGKVGALIILLDGGKAAGAVFMAQAIVGVGLLTIGGITFPWQTCQVVAALAAMAGHNWSVFLKFKGGRGVACFFGAMLAIYPPIGLFGIEVWAITAMRSRYMSMGSLIGVMATWCLLIPLVVAYGTPPIYLVYGLIATGLVIWQHRDNISRLRIGAERRLRSESGGRR